MMHLFNRHKDDYWPESKSIGKYVLIINVIATTKPDALRLLMGRRNTIGIATPRQNLRLNVRVVTIKLPESTNFDIIYNKSFYSDQLNF